MIQGPGESRSKSEDQRMAMKSQNKGMAAAGSEAFSHAGLSPAVSEGVYWCDKPMTKATWALFQLTVSHFNPSPREAGQELKTGRSWRQNLHALNGFLNLLSYTRTAWPGVAPPITIWALPTSIINPKDASQVCPQANLVGAFSQ